MLFREHLVYKYIIVSISIFCFLFFVFCFLFFVFCFLFFVLYVCFFNLFSVFLINMEVVNASTHLDNSKSLSWIEQEEILQNID